MTTFQFSLPKSRSKGKKGPIKTYQENINYANEARYPSVTQIGAQVKPAMANLNSYRRYDTHAESVLFQSQLDVNELNDASYKYSPQKLLPDEPRYDESLFKIINEMEQSETDKLLE